MTEQEQDVSKRVEHVLSRPRKIASIPIVEKESPEEIVGYDEFGAPS